jgi:3-dehydroquinate synthase
MFIFEQGEASKNISTYKEILSWLASNRASRKDTVIALGGGVTGDMAGFAAAIYMRGIDFVQLPTTLLAMVDSSIGGKTGCDLPEGKNLIGAFHQPQSVQIAAERLKTLPDEQYLCGLAEIIKCTAIMDEPFFAELEANVEKIRARDDEFTRRMILKTCALKAKIVEMDEKEGGIRAILNYGHTFGHALEKVSEFSILHGQGVAAGMCMVLEMGEKSGLIPADVVQRQKVLIRNTGLPESYDMDREKVYQALFSDKKTVGGKLRFVITPEMGRAEVVTFQPEVVREYLGI